MKRAIPFLLVGLASVVLVVSQTSFGADSSKASAIAQQQNLLSEYKRLNSAIDVIMETQRSHANRLKKLGSAVQGMREKVATQDEEYATMADIHRLEKAIERLDQKIEKNNKLILQELKKLQRPASARAPFPDTSSESRSKRADAPSKDETGYWYTIEEGQTIFAVVRAYQEDGVDVRLRTVLDANPDVEPKKVQPGDKIWIPDPQ